MPSLLIRETWGLLSEKKDISLRLLFLAMKYEAKSLCKECLEHQPELIFRGWLSSSCDDVELG